MRAEKLVVVKSTATKDYLQKRVVEGNRQPQSYVFMAGHYFAGTTHDNSLDKMPFRTIAQRLAIDLKGQDFHPADSLANADLLLIVHWGVTAGRNNDDVSLALGLEKIANLGTESELAQHSLDEANLRGDLEGATTARDQLLTIATETRSEHQSIRQDQTSSGDDSAALLGLTAELQKQDDGLFGDERRKTLYDMTREERYFLIVMAYDAKTLVSTKKLKRVWTIRTSIRSAGVNFPQALDRMGNIASRYFGTKQQNVSFDYTGDRKRQESVEVGQFTVIGPATP